MDEHEFRDILHLFPVVRSRDYQANLESSRQSISHSTQNVEINEWQNAWDSGSNKEIEIRGIDEQDGFWEKLKLAAGRKLGPAEAERFCKGFQHAHKKLVYEELSLDAARRFLKSSKACGK